MRRLYLTAERGPFDGEIVITLFNRRPYWNKQYTCWEALKYPDYADLRMGTVVEGCAVSTFSRSYPHLAKLVKDKNNPEDYAKAVIRVQLNPVIS